jgi:hypothetical protein
VKSVLRSPGLKVQSASQQVPGARSGFVEKLLLCLAHLFIVDFDPEHQYFFLSAGVMMFKAAPSAAGLCERSILGFRGCETDFEIWLATEEFAADRKQGTEK